MILRGLGTLGAFEFRHDCAAILPRPLGLRLPEENLGPIEREIIEAANTLGNSRGSCWD